MWKIAIVIIICSAVCLLLGGVGGYLIRGTQTTYIGNGENTGLAAAYGKQCQELASYQRRIQQDQRAIEEANRIIREYEKSRQQTYKGFEETGKAITLSVETGSNANEQIYLDSLEAIRIIDSLNQ